MKKGDLVRYFGDECDEQTLRQKYNSSILGYMYRNQELPAALARGQLKHLDEHNQTRIRNSEYLSRELNNIPGVTRFVGAGNKPQALTEAEDRDLDGMEADTILVSGDGSSTGSESGAPSSIVRLQGTDDAEQLADQIEGRWKDR